MKQPVVGSATPSRIMRLLHHSEVHLAGCHTAVIGRSPILGKPMAMALLNANATVTICHSKTEELQKIVQSDELVDAALGKAELVKSEWGKAGAVVVNAGYHPNQVDDLELSVAKYRCAAYTLVPGGVGPITIVTLIFQTVDAAELRLLKAV